MVAAVVVAKGKDLFVGYGKNGGGGDGIGHERFGMEVEKQSKIDKLEGERDQLKSGN